MLWINYYSIPFALTCFRDIFHHFVIVRFAWFRITDEIKCPKCTKGQYC